MKFRFLERRRKRNKLEMYVSPSLEQLIEKSPDGFDPRNEIWHFQFVIVLLDDSSLEELPKILNRVADAILQHRGMISNISASVVVACLGVPFTDADSVEARLRLLNKIIAENGASVRIAHGQCDGTVGNFGSKARFIYEAIIPNFNGILRQLLESPAGAVLEVHGQ